MRDGQRCAASGCVDLAADGRDPDVEEDRPPQGIAMVFAAITRRARRSVARRNAYHRLLREIETFSDCELSEMGTAREAIRHEVRRSVYG